jgi:predicted nucleic acid-binding protein
MPDNAIMLDTSVWVSIFRGHAPELIAQCRNMLRRDRVVTCSPVMFELRRGLSRKNRKTVIPLLGAIPRIGMSEADWDAAGDLDASLRLQGITIPPMDILIARICLHHNVPLLTLDQHFQKIPKLELVSVQ